jgi:hypothetical protein
MTILFVTNSFKSIADGHVGYVMCWIKSLEKAHDENFSRVNKSFETVHEWKELWKF